jgi:hypothetical protein
MPVTRSSKVLIGVVTTIGLAVGGIVGAYWWSNIPPKRPPDVSASAVFLWTGHLGLPALKHGTWIECWADTETGVNKCKLTEMDGTSGYEGVFVADTGMALVPQSDLHIDVENTSNRTFWVRFDKLRGAPLVFLQNGVALIPKDAYQEGLSKLKHLRQVQGKGP